tara:strand:- start:1287 stop:1742 length:456 start_codon:yes stop_codon:yes gene_type:complete
MCQRYDILHKLKLRPEMYEKLTSGYISNNAGVKYIVCNNKTILFVGESRILGECHNRPLDAMHAEENAIRKCLKANINFKNIRILIWKENCSCVKAAFSCNWCKKFIQKIGFPINNMITPEIINGEFSGKFISSVLLETDVPVVMNHDLKT